MHPIRLASLALVLGVVTSCVAYSQPPGYASPSQPGGDYGRGYDDDRYYGAPEPRFEVGFFYDDLSPYGDWVRSPEYGWAWFPRDVRPYWRPYNDGRWVMTEYGWTWISYEPFGWATYHYGRWAWDPRIGWLWVPGTVWGPAWVSWQHGGGYVGWAPLPPTVGFSLSLGLQLGGFDLRLGIRPDAYNFVPERSFLEPRLSGYLLPTARNVTIINNTTNITKYTYNDNRVYNSGVDLRSVERATGKRVQQRRVSEVRTKRVAEVVADEVRVYRPEQQKLEAVRGKERAEKEHKSAGRPAATREQQQPAVQRRDAPEIVVAPRTDRAPRPDSRKLEQQDRREKQQLERHQAEEKMKVEKLQKEENARARAQADRSQIEKRHQEEREALVKADREAARQLEARQKAKREAALAKPPAEEQAKGKNEAATVKQDEKKGKAKAEAEKKEAAEKKAKGQQKKESKGGQEKKSEPPPPA